MTIPLRRFSLAARVGALVIAALSLGGLGEAPAQFTAAERGQIAEALASAPAHGLPAQPPTASDAAARDAVLAYGAQQYGGRVRPRDIDSEWGITPRAPPTAAQLETARVQGGLATWIEGLAPDAPGYRNLVRLRATYAAYVENGLWPQVPGGPSLKAGSQSDRIAVLRRRLAAEGYGSADADQPELFDSDLAAEVLRFQLAHGLEPDSVVGPATLAALNVTPRQRVDQIDANLERWRWLPRPLPAERIEVDVAAATAAYFVGGEPVLRMRIVVGDLTHRTPLFYSAVSSIVINPPWNVPASIAQAEILPRAARDPGYLARNNFRYIDGRLQQAPGPGSALGVLKFDFPSPYGVYLHDTPGKAAFDQRVRTLSHGCMRLQQPRELALLLLARQGWTQARLDAAISGGITQAVPLERTTPLILVYRTAEGLGDGSGVFRPDPYGWDAKLDRALKAARPPLALAAPIESECSPN